MAYRSRNRYGNATTGRYSGGDSYQNGLMDSQSRYSGGGLGIKSYTNRASSYADITSPWASRSSGRHGVSQYGQHSSQQQQTLHAAAHLVSALLSSGGGHHTTRLERRPYYQSHSGSSYGGPRTSTSSYGRSDTSSLNTSYSRRGTFYKHRGSSSTVNRKFYGDRSYDSTRRSTSTKKSSTEASDDKANDSRTVSKQDESMPDAKAEKAGDETINESKRGDSEKKVGDESGDIEASQKAKPERERDTIDSKYLNCYVCRSVEMESEDAFLTHVKSWKHKHLMELNEERMETSVKLFRLEVQMNAKLEEFEAKERGEDVHKNSSFCAMCRIRVFGDLQEHRISNHLHIKLKSFLHPRCCGMRFDTPNLYQHHLLSFSHFRRMQQRDKDLKRALVEGSTEDAEKEPEDCVLPVQDIQEILHSSSLLRSDNLSQTIDDEGQDVTSAEEVPDMYDGCKKIGVDTLGRTFDGIYCSVCRVSMPVRIWPIHCQSIYHFNRFASLKRAERYRNERNDTDYEQKNSGDSVVDSGDFVVVEDADIGSDDDADIRTRKRFFCDVEDDVIENKRQYLDDDDEKMKDDGNSDDETDCRMDGEDKLIDDVLIQSNHDIELIDEIINEDNNLDLEIDRNEGMNTESNDMIEEEQDTINVIENSIEDQNSNAEELESAVVVLGDVCSGQGVKAKNFVESDPCVDKDSIKDVFDATEIEETVDHDVDSSLIVSSHSAVDSLEKEQQAECVKEINDETANNTGINEIINDKSDISQETEDKSDVVLEPAQEPVQESTQGSGQSSTDMFHGTPVTAVTKATVSRGARRGRSVARRSRGVRRRSSL